MLVLFETSAGFALFKVLDEGKMKSKPAEINNFFATPEKASSFVSLKKFYKFDGTLDALEAQTALAECKVPESLSNFLKKNVVSEKLNEQLIVSDSKFGNAIKDALNIKVLCDDTTQELIRGIRLQLKSLVNANEQDLNAMSIGLSHSYSRYKLKFSPDKVDTMIVQAISLLDDLTTEINIYAMRAREWYGWHFPELGKLITNHTQYANAIKAMGNRKSAVDTDFTDILPEEVAEEVKEAAQISMGTEISPEDLDHIFALCDQFLSIQAYHTELTEYLKSRMEAIAPNLTILVGEIVGARLICRAGSLMNLAKYPASTIQILGAEKALFRALKTKHNTPKYGLIYNAKIVGEASLKNKGKMSRVLAAKAALSARFDALCEVSDTSYGIAYKGAVDRRAAAIEGREVRKSLNAVKPEKSGNVAKYDHTKSATTNTTRDVATKSSKESSIKQEKADIKMEEASSSDDSSSDSSSSEDEKSKKSKKSKKEEPVKEEKKSKKEEKKEEPVKEEKKEKKSKKEEKKEEPVKEEKKEKKDKKEKKEEKEEKKEKKEEKKEKKDKKEKTEEAVKEEKKDKKDKKEKKDEKEEKKEKKDKKEKKEEKEEKKEKKSSKEDKKRKDRDEEPEEKKSKKSKK
ncbi:hypothetical protein ACTFIU_000474 [Dictyostelium citrinum]